MDLIKDIVEKSGVDVRLVIMDRFEDEPTISGRYNIRSHIIELATDTIEEVFENLKPLIEGVTKEELIQIIVAHELGHASDTTTLKYLAALKRWNAELSVLILHGEKQEVKQTYQYIANLSLQAEVFAWRIAPRYFTNNVNKQRYRKMEHLILSQNKEEKREEFKRILLTHKAYPVLLKLFSLRPFKTKIVIDENGIHPSEYIKKGNVFKLNMRHLLGTKEDDFKQKMSSFDYICYQSLYECLRLRYKRKILRFRKKRIKAFRYADKAKHHSKMIYLLKKTAEDILTFEEQVLDKLAPLFPHSSTYKAFKKIRLDLVKIDLDVGKSKCEFMFEESEQKRKQLINT